MTPSEAERVVNEYGVVLERSSHMVHGVPETLLPFEKEVIKRAIKIVLTFLKTNPRALHEDYAEYIEQLKIGYASLANFISVEDARIAAAANAALASGSVNHPDWNLCDRGAEILSAVNAHWKTLADEIAIFVKRL